MKKAILLIPFILFFSCQSKKTVDKLNWMNGEWIKEGESVAQTIEGWKTISETEMEGFGLTIENGDTIFYEKLSIVSRGKNLYYVADIGEGKVDFKLIESSNEKWVFENLNHDFPKRIKYVKEGNRMIAFAEAEETSLEFRFRRVE